MDGVRWTARKPLNVGPLEQALECFRTTTCRQVAEAYLQLLRGNNGGIPAKNGVDLTGFAAAMSDLALTAVIKPDRCIWRLAGEKMQRRIGLDPIGRNYYDFVPAVRRKHAIRAMHMVVDLPCAFRVEIEQDFGEDVSRRVEVVGLPLSSDEAGVDGFILFGEREIDPDPEFPTDGIPMSGANVLRRDLIDLGYGVDENFEDIVPA